MKGKRPEDLPLDPAPLTPAVEPDPRDTAWWQFAQEIDELIDSQDYGWAADTLTGIRESVLLYKVVTEGQRRAVRNVRAAKESPRREGFRRRYEGWGR